MARQSKSCMAAQASIEIVFIESPPAHHKKDHPAMPRRCLKVGALLLAPALLATPAPAFAGFETVDQVPFPSHGGFPAYPGEGEARRPTALYVEAGAMY